ncbi:MAG TPA: metallophosphoesterase, partial [Casimicrobiaceae bacterium]
MLRLLHVSDLHFGVDNLPEQVDAIETLIRSAAYDVVAVSGDLTQRARRLEFVQARGFLDRAAAVCTVVVVPGNHDVTWWRAPMHIGAPGWMYAKWRQYLGRGIEPVVRIGGTTIAGVNTAHGVAPYTLTRRPRDLSVIGALRATQIERLSREFSQHPVDRRVVVMHHNPVRGE